MLQQKQSVEDVYYHEVCCLWQYSGVLIQEGLLPRQQKVHQRQKQSLADLLKEQVIVCVTRYIILYMEGIQLAYRVAGWLRFMPLNPGSCVQTLHRITTMIPHMTPVLVGSRKWTWEVIYISFKNLFHNQVKIKIFKLVTMVLSGCRKA